MISEDYMKYMTYMKEYIKENYKIILFILLIVLIVGGLYYKTKKESFGTAGGSFIQLMSNRDDNQDKYIIANNDINNKEGDYTYHDVKSQYNSCNC
jgi:predicted negative regulator of RcsB-dependent stress response